MAGVPKVREPTATRAALVPVEPVRLSSRVVTAEARSAPWAWTSPSLTVQGPVTVLSASSQDWLEKRSVNCCTVAPEVCWASARRAYSPIRASKRPRTDLPLTEPGIAQATAVQPVITRLLEGEGPVVFTSPLRRAADTAKLALPGVQATVVDSLLELDYGEYEGLKTREILTLDPSWNLFEGGCPGGEKPAEFSARCDAFVELLQRTAPGRAVVAFTHGHLSRVLTARLLGLPVSTAPALFNETASVSVINVHRGRWVLVGWNIRSSESPHRSPPAS